MTAILSLCISVLGFQQFDFVRIGDVLWTKAGVGSPLREEGKIYPQTEQIYVLEGIKPNSELREAWIPFVTEWIAKHPKSVRHKISRVDLNQVGVDTLVTYVLIVDGDHCLNEELLKHGMNKFELLSVGMVEKLVKEEQIQQWEKRFKAATAEAERHKRGLWKPQKNDE